MVTPAESREAGRYIGQDFGEGTTKQFMEEPMSMMEEYEYGSIEDYIADEASMAEMENHQMADWTNGIGAEITNRCSEPFNAGEECFTEYEKGVATGIREGISNYFRKTWCR